MTSSFNELVYDVKRFVLHFQVIINTWPLQVYASALVCSPTGSTVRQLYQRDYPQWMIAVFGVETDWTNCLQVLLHGQEIDFNSLVFSEDSSTLFTADSYSIKG
jgi:hypothetical protein